jgi:hypothetical protein
VPQDERTLRERSISATKSERYNRHVSSFPCAKIRPRNSATLSRSAGASICEHGTTVKAQRRCRPLGSADLGSLTAQQCPHGAATQSAG